MIPKEKFEEEFMVPNLEKKERVIRKVLAFLKKYSGSTLQEIAEALVGLEEWCEIRQALETLKTRGEIESKLLYQYDSGDSDGHEIVIDMYVVKEKE